MSDQGLEFVAIGPEDGDASVIWLHGLGADGWDFASIVPELALPAAFRVRFLFPHAPLRPITINGGMVMRGWYDILTLDRLQGAQDERGIRDSATRIMALVESELRRGVTPRRVILAGFSQGGAMALHCAVRAPAALGGVVALSCYLALADTLASEMRDSARQTPVFMAHGTADPMIGLPDAELSREVLRSVGVAVDFRTYPMAHAVHPAEISAIAEFLEERLGGASLQV